MEILEGLIMRSLKVEQYTASASTKSSIAVGTKTTLTSTNHDYENSPNLQSKPDYFEHLGSTGYLLNVGRAIYNGVNMRT